MISADSLILGSLQLNSRLIVGSGRYESLEQMQECHRLAGTEMVTVALRRLPLDIPGQERPKSITDYIDISRIRLLPNTAGSQTGKEALRVAKMAEAMGASHVKIEVMHENKTLLPDPVETLRAVELIRSETSLRQLYLMVYSNDDPILAKKLYDAGANCVMPGASPIGSGRGLQNIANLILIREIIDGKIPLIIDAGIGSPADACKAMELGFDAVLLNTAIARARQPLLMAEAFKNAVIAGRQAHLAGIMDRKLYATASSPHKDY